LESTLCPKKNAVNPIFPLFFPRRSSSLFRFLPLATPQCRLSPPRNARDPVNASTFLL
jgi:hypothetical protein